jgi:type VI secretion system secreted protein Hcp
MAIYMKYDGVDGDVTESGHQNWIELKSFDWRVSRGVSSSVGSSADRESTAPSVSEVAVKKDNDVATGGLMQEALAGHGKTVKIDFTRTYKGKQEVYLSLELDNTIISGLSHSGSDRPEERLVLNFTKVQFSTTQMKADGTPGDPSHVTYDLTTAKVS